MEEIPETALAAIPPVLHLVVAVSAMAIGLTAFLAAIVVGRTKRYLIPVHVATGIYLLFGAASRIFIAMNPGWGRLYFFFNIIIAVWGFTAAFIGMKTLWVFNLKNGK